MAFGAMKPQGSQAMADAVRCLAVPLVGDSLLVPYTAVAEVIGYEAAAAVPNAPRWLTGLLGWRGASVPLVTFECLLGADNPYGQHRAARVVVFNTLNGNTKLPFLAMPADGIPRLTLATAEDLENVQKRSGDGAAVLQRVKMAAGEFIVPDFDALEQMLVRLGI